MKVRIPTEAAISGKSASEKFGKKTRTGLAMQAPFEHQVVGGLFNFSNFAHRIGAQVGVNDFHERFKLVFR